MSGIEPIKINDVTVTFILILVVTCSGRATAADNVVPLVLAENGKTKYRIVIGDSAAYGEEQAAEELALFLGKIDGGSVPYPPG